MKQFLQNFAMCLVLVEVFIFFGGWMLFDFDRHVFLAGASVAFLLAVFISMWLSQEDRIEKLEERIAALEHPDTLSDNDKENEP